MRRRSLLPAVSGLMLLVASGCGDDDVNRTGPPITTVEDHLDFRDAEGQPIDFGPGAETFIWCGPWESDVEEPALHVFVGTVDPPRAWQLMVVLDDVDPGESVTFPNEFVFDQPRNAHLFIVDPPNQGATDTEDSFGAITFTRIACGTDGAVEFTIDATIGSEFGDGPIVTVTGSFRGPVGNSPDWYDGGN
ncbi:MAG TPA: hypothetical protein VF720_03770 [Candidatus Eisenbacteria bacterium]